MSLQDILKKIAVNAQNEIDQTKSEVKAEKAKLEKASSEIEAQELKTLESKTSEALQSVDEKTASMARRENKQRMLMVKRQVLNQAMDQLLSQLEGADDDLCTEINTKLVKALPFTAGELRVPASRVAMMKKIASGFEVVSDDSIKGGFVASHGGQEVDSTFANLVHSEYRSELEMHISHQLKII